MSENEKLEINEEEIEIIDFQSEDRSGSIPQANNPVPNGIKWMLGGVAMVLLVGMGSLYAFKGKSHSTSPVGEDVMQIGGDSDKAVATDVLLASLDKNNAQVKLPKKPGLTIGPVTEQDKINERVVSLETQLQQMTQQIDDLTSQGKIIKKMNTQMGQIADHIETLPTQDDLTEMKQDFNKMLQQTKDELKNSLAKSYKKAKKYVSKKKTYSAKNMPFKLVSIDQWNGVDYAAIQSKNIGAIENLRSGDTRSGWKVERIDTVESSVVFKDTKTGRSIKQSAI
jgi:hypothetical protein